MESIRKRVDIELVTNPIRAKKLVAKPTTLNWNIISDNYVSTRKQKPKIIIDRPIYLGFCMFDLSKIPKYKFHYEILHKSGSRAKLAYTDTGSLSLICKHMTFIKTWRTTWTRRYVRLSSRPIPPPQLKDDKWRTNARAWRIKKLFGFEPKCTFASPKANWNLQRKATGTSQTSSLQRLHSHDENNRVDK